MFKLLIEPFILPEMDTYINRVCQNEIFKQTVIRTVIRLFKSTSKNQDDDLVDPDIELFVTSKENEGWAKLFCQQLIPVHVKYIEYSDEEMSETKKNLPSYRSSLMSVYDIKQFVFLGYQLG
jgi:hypothetical protein